MACVFVHKKKVLNVLGMFLLRGNYLNNISNFSNVECVCVCECMRVCVCGCVWVYINIKCMQICMCVYCMVRRRRG